MKDKVLGKVLLELGITWDPDELQKSIDKYTDELQKYERSSIEARELQAKIDDAQDGIDQSSSSKSTVQALGGASDALNKTADAGVKLLKGMFSILEELHGRLVSASPLLQTIEQLFSLAVDLFFMPIGNALAEEMIPATLELVDGVMAMWDAFEGKTLGEMVTEAVKYGVDLFSQYFETLGTQLAEQGGLVGSIGKMLLTISNIIDALPKLIEVGITILTTVMENLDKIIAAIVAFKVASLAMQVAMMYVIATSNTIAGWAGAGYVAAIGGTVAGATAGAITYGAISDTLNMSGTSGSNVGQTNVTNNTYNISGIMSYDEMEKIVSDKVDSKTSLSAGR